jgi:hypothetical protein
MSRFVDSDIGAIARANAAQLRALIVAVGKARAPQYAPDGKYQEPPVGIENIYIEECNRYPAHTVNPDGAVVQMCVEAAGWQSALARNKNNPAGIGAEDDDPYNKALTFATPREAVRAQVAHLLDYRWGRGPWTADDPRAANMPANWFGSCLPWSALQGRWATSPTYAQSLESVWTQLDSIINEGTPMAGDRLAMMKLLNDRYPLTVRISYAPVTNPNIPNQPANAEGRRWETVHETANPAVGANAEMHRKFVHNGGGADASKDYEGVSFHWVVDDTEVVGLVDPTMKAWQASDGADGTGNSSESTETCINADGDWGKTKENLARHLARRIVVDPNRSPDRIAQHNKWARDHKNCPTKLRANNGAEWNALIARVRTILTDVGYFGAPSPTPPADDGWRLHLGNGQYTAHALRLGFRGVIEGLAIQRYPDDPNSAALSIVGDILEDEWPAADDCTYQTLRNFILKYTPGNSKPWDVSVLPSGTALPARKPV